MIMKKSNKQKLRRFALLLAVVALCPLLLGAMPSHTPEYYVNDYADVLSDETESHIFDTARQLDIETTAQVCVLTIDSLEGKDISENSVEVFRKWGIGNKDMDNVVLILLSVGDREMWVTTGYGIEGTLTDTKLGVFRDTYAFPYYKQNDFDTGTLEIFNAIVSEIRTEEYGLEALEGYESTITYQGEMPDGFYILVGIGLCLSALLFLVLPPFLIFGLWAWKMHLRKYDALHGTSREAEFIRKTQKIKKILLILWIFSKRNNYGGTRSFRGGGFHGGGGFGGGGGSTGGGGAGGRF